MRLLGLVAIIAAVWLLLKSMGGTAAAAVSTAPAPAAPTPASYNGMDDFIDAIFQKEGGQPGNRNVINNNPGNLRSAAGQTGTQGGFATFADQGDGYGALTDLVNRRTSAHPDWDFYDWFAYYLRGSTTAPTSDAQGNSDTYAEYVANYMGVDPTQTVSSALYGN